MPSDLSKGVCKSEVWTATRIIFVGVTVHREPLA